MENHIRYLGVQYSPLSTQIIVQVCPGVTSTDFHSVLGHRWYTTRLIHNILSHILEYLDASIHMGWLGMKQGLDVVYKSEGGL